MPFYRLSPEAFHYHFGVDRGVGRGEIRARSRDITMHQYMYLHTIYLGPTIPIANTCLGVAKWAHNAFRSISARHEAANIRIEEALN